jgi:hypothetical protein
MLNFGADSAMAALAESAFGVDTDPYIGATAGRVAWREPPGLLGVLWNPAGGGDLPRVHSSAPH